jgi:hypothetical protein
MGTVTLAAARARSPLHPHASAIAAWVSMGEIQNGRYDLRAGQIDPRLRVIYLGAVGVPIQLASSPLT